MKSAIVPELKNLRVCICYPLSTLSLSSESGGADTLSRIERGSYAFPDEPVVSAEAEDFVGKVRLLLIERQRPRPLGLRLLYDSRK